MPPLRGSWGSRHVGGGQHCILPCGGGHLAGSGGKPPARLDLEALWDVPSLMLPVWVRSWNIVLSPLHPQAKWLALEAGMIPSPFNPVPKEGGMRYDSRKLGGRFFPRETLRKRILKTSFEPQISFQPESEFPTC